MGLNDVAVLVAPTMLTAILAIVGVSIRFLFQIKASQARIEANQKYQETIVLKNTASIAFLKERTAGLESAVFHRPPVLEEEV